MEQLFVSRDGRERPRWREAFDCCVVAAQVSEALALSRSGRPVLWLDTAGLDTRARDARLAEAVASGSPVVVMSPTPGEREALDCLNRGAVGYCHVEAVPEQLREISVVVQHGGLWMLPELVQRFMRLSQRVVPTPAPERPELNELTARELMVAEQVARGASNQEIAAALAISERTVKAHLSSIFDKLDLRDRVQLALAMNNIPTVTSVN
ncbi:response regulator transcription factor [Parahaliea mediterranea]|uniref:Response regulator transcription factor n=1 Tax=Parahaliea mediterranea TaxID=651086 RepID=A0A939IIX4_9GAMM|nr:response regulator transcription factor [Parahaliea mediterranea]MBN7795691.1 response regulator transcription factor [Parahaliea mediterranea]